MRGLRVHITGSAAEDCDPSLLSAHHSFVRAFVAETIARGGGLVLGAGGEPRGKTGDPCIFDWTALERIAGAPDPAPEWPELRPHRFIVATSQRGLEKVPEDRMLIWEQCRQRSDLDLVVGPAGWRMAGIIRERQALHGDILLALGGGAGVEHLAKLYHGEGKPVIPLYTDIGAYQNDGRGGSRFLYETAVANTDTFFRLRDNVGSATGRLSALQLTASANPVSIAEKVAELLSALRPRPAFYVRLLEVQHADFVTVERFFRNVVDKVVDERGFTPQEMGRGRPETAFINVELFRALHHAGLVVVDLTGVRPNCMMELGYALARRKRVVISARKGTPLPFDADKLPTYMWEDSSAGDEHVSGYREWCDRCCELPPIVED